MRDQNIIIHESNGNETIWDVIYQLYPNIETREQLNSMYSAIFILNKHTKRFDSYFGESFYFPDKNLLDKSHIVFPDYHSALYGSIMGFEKPDFNMVNLLSLLVTEEFQFLESCPTVNENIHKSLSTIGFVNMMGVSEALEEIATELRMRDHTLYLMTKDSNIPVSEPTSTGDGIIDGLLKEYNTSNLMKESGKAAIEQAGVAVTGIANKIKELDYLLIQYALDKNKKKKQIKMEIINKYAQLQKIIPLYIQKKIAEKAKKLPNKNHGAQALSNIKKGIKKAQDLKKINKGLKEVIQKFGRNELKLKNGNFFERYAAAKNKAEIMKKLDDPNIKKKLVITNSEYSSRLKLMSYASKISSKVVIGLNVYLGFDKIQTAYNNDEDWLRTTAEVSGDLIFGIAAGLLFNFATANLITAASAGGGLIISLSLTIVAAAAGIGVGIAAGYAGSAFATQVYDKIKNLKNDDKKANFIKEMGVICIPIN